MANEFIARKGFISLEGAQITGSLSATGNISSNTLTVTNGITGTATSASYVEYSNVAGKPALVSSSAQIIGYGIFPTTGSNQFNGAQAITGSLTVTGQVIAQTLNVQQVTSSIVYSSGSNVFGNSLSNTQQFTGSVSVTGSLAVAGAGTFSSSVTAGGNFLMPAGSGLAWSGDATRIITPEDNVSGALIQTPGIVRFNVGGTTERVRITADGNVLIGTTDNASFKLDVNGSFRTGANGIALDSSGFAVSPNTNRPWNAFRYSHPQNIIPNGDLESWTSGTSTAPDGFGGYDLGASTIITRESSSIKEGLYSAKISNPTGASFSGMAYDGVRIDKTPSSSGSSSYTISFWYLTPNANGSTSYIGIYDTAANSYSFIESLPKAGVWVFYSRTFSIRDDSDWGINWWVSWGAGTANDVLYVDSIALNKGNQIYNTTRSSVSTTGNVSRWGNFYNLGGNVGIGTTSPASLLHINGSGNTFTRYTNTSNSGHYIDVGANGASESFVYGYGAYPLLFGTNGSERMRITSGGNVGIGTTSPAQKLQINGPLALSNLAEDFTTNQEYAYPIIYASNLSGLGNGELVIQPRTTATRSIRFVTRTSGAVSGTNPDTRMIIRWDGNVGIGTTSPSQKLEVVGGEIKAGRVDSSSEGGQVSFGRASDNATGWYIDAYGSTSSPDLRFVNVSAGSVVATLTGGGFLKASNNGAYLNSAGTFHELRSSTGNSYSSIVQHSDTSQPYGLGIFYTAASPNSTNYEFIYCQDSTQSKFIVWSNGNAVNRNGSYGTISDIKFKENIVDATPKLDDILKLKVRNFNFIGEEQKQIGFIAQEFEEVFPSMVDTSIDKETEEEYKSIKTSILIPMLVKGIQELKSENDALKEILQRNNIS